MKKSSNDIVRSLFLMAVMIIIGAGSAFAQTESDYFSLTKNAGTESERTSYYTTFAGAVEDAADGDKITLLKDYTISPDYMTTDDIYGVSINKSITLDLNDHTITRNTKEIDEYRGALISIDGATLTLVDNGADKYTMGSIENIDVCFPYGIVVGNGSTLIAKGVKILTPDRDTVYIDDDGTAEFDDCVIHGKLGIKIYGTATITNSDISGGNAGAIQVGGEEQVGGVVTQVYYGCLTIGKDVYISGYYQDGIGLERGSKVILKALPTFERTRDPEPRRNIAMGSGCSLIFEEGTFNTPDQPISIYITDNNGPVDPTIYTNPITTNYSKYVKDGGKVIDPNDVFSWYNYYDNYTDGFRLDAAGEMVFSAVKASVSTYNAGSAPTIANYTTLADALEAAQAGYVAGNGGDEEEFIPTVTLLADVVAKEKGFSIGDGKTTKMTLDLNDHNITGDKYIEHILIVINDGATLTLVDNGDDKDKMGSIKNNDELNHGAIFIASGGRLNAKGVIIFSDWDTIINYGTAEFDDCKIKGKYAIDIYGTATITNSDIIGGAGSALLVGGEERENGVVTQVYDGCLTIGEDVYISGFVNQGIHYQFGTVILKALPTFTERPTTSSTTRAKTRDAETYDIAIPPGRSLTFEEGTFNTTGRQPISIYIKEDGVPIDPAIYTNPITTNYSKYVKDGGEVIDPNEVFRWYGNNVIYSYDFRMNTAGEVVFDHAAATVTSYDVDNSTVTTTPYYDFSEAIAAANSGYKTALEAGGTEFIPTLKMLDDVSIDKGVEIGDGSTVTKVTLDLNDHELKGNCDAGTIIVKGKATLNLVDTGTDNSKGVVWNSKNETGTNCIYVWNGGELTATKVSFKSDMGTALLNNGSTTVGEGVSFSGNREASIYNHQGTLTLTAWPTFGGSTTEGYADIKLYSGRAVTFGGTGLGTPTQKVTLRMVDSSDSDVDAATYTYAITDGYGAKVTDANGPIDPNEVFEWYKEIDCVEFYFNGTESTITVRYKITYNGVDGATFETANPTTYTVESDAITLNNPTRNGYVFVGWYDNENFTGDAITTIAKGSTGDKTFYARWKIQTEISVQNTSLELKVLDEVATGATLTNVVSSTAVTDENVTLTYTSSNSNVAKVEDGNIICLAAGTATITVSFAGNDKYVAAESKTMNVTVSLNDASVSVSDGENEITSLNLYVDDTYTIVPTTTPEGLDVTYVPDDSGVVSVDENGKVTALKAGTGSIHVKVGGDGVYTESTATVTVNSYLKVDANRDKVVNVADIVEMVNDNAPQSDIDAVVNIIMGE